MESHLEDGIWGQPSSTLDWCEKNYVVSYYIAEFWNTVSNIFMIIPPLFAGIHAYREKQEMTLVLCHIGVTAVGIGSWCFHMTLLYSMQLLDELPMIWSSSFLLYSLAELRRPKGHHNKLFQLLIFFYCSIVTFVYLVNKNPFFHEVAYGIMVGGMILSSCRLLIYYNVMSARFYVLAFLTYASAFILWNIDNLFCGSISKSKGFHWAWEAYFRNLRDVSPSLLRPFTQFHAWWHVLAGVGTYLCVLCSTHARYTHLKKYAEIKFFLKVWPYVTIIQHADPEKQL